MRSLLFVAASSLALTACGVNDAEEKTDRVVVAEPDPAEDYGYETYDANNLADTMASNDDAYGMGDSVALEDQDIPDSRERPIMQVQVVLDRVGFGPGVIDGKMGMSTENALRGFQEANELEVTGELDDATRTALSDWDSVPATRIVTVPASWGTTKYSEIPEDPGEKAELEKLGYTSLDERLAERFHTTIEVLRELNPNRRPAGIDSAPEASDGERNPPPTLRPGDGYFAAGQQIRVPNVGADRIDKGVIDDRDWLRTLASLGVGTEQPEVDRIVVSKAGKTLKAYKGAKLVALFTVSSGSSQFPLPLGEWDIVGEAYNPPYRYDPEVLGEDKGDSEVHRLPAGPNSPVGVVWIDLSKEHYGIHGTPDPETIGRAQSSGCVRLTNWDAARLAGMVSQSTEVIFEA